MASSVPHNMDVVSHCSQTPRHRSRRCGGLRAARQFGVAEFEATESNSNPTPESTEGSSLKWSLAVGVAGVSGTLPTPSQGQYEGNSWHFKVGWTTTSAGPSSGAEGGIYGAVVKTEHLGRFLECECDDTRFDD